MPTDITANLFPVKGVNSPNNYTRSAAYVIDGNENPGILAVDTHSLFKIPKGNVLTGLKVVSLVAAASGGAATIQFKASINAVAEAIHTAAIGKADLAAGDVAVLPVTGIKAYDEANDTVVQLVVAGAALTALNLMVIAEFIPVSDFICAG